MKKFIVGINLGGDVIDKLDKSARLNQRSRSAEVRKILMKHYNLLPADDKSLPHWACGSDDIGPYRVAGNGMRVYEEGF